MTQPAMRKRHNHSAFIDPRLVENLLAEGHSMGEIAWHLSVDRKTLINRANRNSELREAIKIGKERKKARLIGPTLEPAGAAEELESLLICLLRDVRSLRGALGA